MTIRSIDVLFRDFETNGVPSSGLHKPIKRDIRDTLNAIAVGGSDASTRIIQLHDTGAGSPNNIVVDASEPIPSAAYSVLFILEVTQANTGSSVTVSGDINRTLVTNTGQNVIAGYLQPGMAVLAADTGSELRMLSYGDAEAILADAEALIAQALIDLQNLGDEMLDEANTVLTALTVRSESAAADAETSAEQAADLVEAATAGFTGFPDGQSYDFGWVTDSTTYFNQDWGTV